MWHYDREWTQFCSWRHHVRTPQFSVHGVSTVQANRATISRVSCGNFAEFLLHRDGTSPEFLYRSTWLFWGSVLSVTRCINISTVGPLITHVFLTVCNHLHIILIENLEVTLWKNHRVQQLQLEPQVTYFSQSSAIKFVMVARKLLTPASHKFKHMTVINYHVPKAGN